MTNRVGGVLVFIIVGSILYGVFLCFARLDVDAQKRAAETERRVDGQRLVAHEFLAAAAACDINAMLAYLSPAGEVAYYRAGEYMGDLHTIAARKNMCFADLSGPAIWASEGNVVSMCLTEYAGVCVRFEFWNELGGLPLISIVRTSFPVRERG